MAWQTPKTNWGPADGVRDSDFNRIEGNILELYNGTLGVVDTTIYVSTTGNDTTGNGTSAAPYKTLTKALSTLPKNLNGKTITLNIAAGTYAEDVTIEHFVGGIITLTGTAGNIATFNSLTISDCVVYTRNITVAVVTGMKVLDGALFSTTSNIRVTGAENAVEVSDGATAIFGGTLNVSNSTNRILMVTRAGRVYANNVTGTANSMGIWVATGGIVQYSSFSAAITGSQFYIASGGRIYSGSQTEAPLY